MPAPSPDLEVVVVTRDRSDILEAFALPQLNVLASLNICTSIIDQSEGRGTEVLAARYPAINYVRSATRGLAQGRNHALKSSSAHVVAFTDDDVVVSVEWITAIWNAFRDNPSAGAVLGRGRKNDGTLMGGGPPGAHQWPVDALSLGSGYSLALKREAARALGGFATAFGAGSWIGAAEDTEILLRLLRQGYLIVCDDSVVVDHPDWRRSSSEAWRQFRYGRGTGTIAAASLLAGDWTTVRFFGGKLAQRATWVADAASKREWMRSATLSAYFVGAATAPEALIYLANQRFRLIWR